MKFYCDECDLKIQEYVDWTIHLVSPGHQCNVEMKVDEWVDQQNPKCLVIIANPLEIQYSVCDVVATLLSYGTLVELCIYLLEDNRSLYVVEYELSDSAEYALSNLTKNKSWKIDSVQKLSDLRLLDWTNLLPDHAFTKAREKARAATTMSRAVPPPPPEKIRRLEDSCFLFSKDCAAKRVLQELAASEDPHKALHVELGRILPSIYAAHRMKPGSVPVSPSTSTSSVSIKTEPVSPRVGAAGAGATSVAADADTSIQKTPVRSPNQIGGQGMWGEVDNRNGKARKMYRKRKSNDRSSSDTSTAWPASPERRKEPKLNGVCKMESIPVRQEAPSSSPPSSELTGTTTATTLLSGKDQLEAEMQEFYNGVSLSLEDLQNIKEVVIRDLESILRTKFQNCRLDMFDTIVAGKSNMVEIHVHGRDEINYGDLSLNDKKDRQGLEARESSRMTRDIFNLLHGRMRSEPSKRRFIKKIKMQLDGYMSHLRFVHTAAPNHKLMLACCISRPQVTRRQDFKLLEFYMKLNPRVRQLLCYIQFWADSHGLIAFSKIKDYVLSILVIVMLTKQRVLPSLATIQFFCEKYIDTTRLNWLIEFCDNEELCNGIAATIRSEFIYSRNADFSLLEMMREFFVMYGNKTLHMRVIATWTAQLLTHKVFYQQGPTAGMHLKEYRREVKMTGRRFRVGSTISVQDPFELTFNVGSTIPIPVFRAFQRKCIEAAVIINRLLKKRRGTGTGLDDLDYNFQSLFTPEVSPERVAPPNQSSFSGAAMTPAVPIESVRSAMGARFKQRLTALNISPPIPDDFIKYAFFKMEPEFYEAFEAHMRRVDSRAVPSQVRLQSCRLWSTFALHFIRSIWDFAFSMDTVESPFIQQMIGRDESYGRYEIDEPDPAFPVGYNLYYGLIDCKGYIGQAVSTRTKLRMGRLAQIKFPHPWDLEREITAFSKSLESNREIGKVTWRLECEVMYEDLPTPSSVRNPMVMFMLHGTDRDVLQYMCDTMRRTFTPWQLFMLKNWFNRKEEFVGGETESSLSEGSLNSLSGRPASTASASTAATALATGTPSTSPTTSTESLHPGTGTGTGAESGAGTESIGSGSKRTSSLASGELQSTAMQTETPTTVTPTAPTTTPPPRKRSSLSLSRSGSSSSSSTSSSWGKRNARARRGESSDSRSSESYSPSSYSGSSSSDCSD